MRPRRRELRQGGRIVRARGLDLLAVRGAVRDGDERGRRLVTEANRRATDAAANAAWNGSGDDPDEPEMRALLLDAGYEGPISIEAVWEDMAAQAADAYTALRQLVQEAGF